MLARNSSLIRLLLTAAIVASGVGCTTKDAKSPSPQLATPVSPSGYAISLTTNRNTLTTGSDKPALITVAAFKYPEWTPVPDQTQVTLTTNLGGFDSIGGATSLTLVMLGGQATANLFAGDVAGTARVQASVLGTIDLVNITIKDSGPVVVPPAAATMTLQATPTFVTGDDSATDSLALSALVIGTDGKPFSGAGVSFSSPVGTLATAGVVKTNSSGIAGNTLDVTDADIAATSGSSFTVTAQMVVEGGGVRTATFSVSIVRAPTANSISLILQPDATMDDDGTAQAATLHATVTDNTSQPLVGATVTFSTGLGALTSTTGLTDANGVAEVTLNVTAAQLANFCAATFTVTASVPGHSANATVTISRAPLNASFTYVGNSSTNVDFTDTSSGTPDTWGWDFNNDGTVDLTTQNPTGVDLTGYGFSAGDTKTVRFVVHRGSCSSSTALQSVTNPL